MLTAQAHQAKLPYDPIQRSRRSSSGQSPGHHADPADIALTKISPNFIAGAKQQPGEFNYASAGLGNWTTVHGLSNSQAGIEIVNVVYRSGAEMPTSVLRDESDVTAITVSTASAL